MSTLSYQLGQLGFPPEIEQHASKFSLNKLDAFTSKYIVSLIDKYGIKTVQSAIDSDSNPHNSVINYLTCLVELGMLHELYHQSFASTNPKVLNQRMEFIAWATNIAVANNLKDNGVERIPSLGNGQIYIYYSWNNMEIIIRRIMPIVSQLEGAMSNEVQAYIDNLILEKLK